MRCDILNDDGFAQLKEVLQVCVRILTWRASEVVRLHHWQQTSAEFEVSSPDIDSGPNGHVGNSGGGVLAE